jgi:mannosyltransferase
MVAAAALVVLSLIPPLEQDGPTLEETGFRWRWSLLAALVIIPSGLILGFGLYKPAYEKFLLVVAAPLSVLVALGILSGWRIATGIGIWGENSGMVGYRAVVLLLVGLFLVDSGRSLYNLYFSDAYHRADYRAIAQRIEEQARPGDAVILNAPNQWEVFTYYYGDDDSVFPLARQRPLDAAANQAELEQIARDHQRIFAVFWGDAESDPERVIESWLETHTYKAGEVWYGDVRLAVYAVPTETADAPEVPLKAIFSRDADSDAPIIFLDGYTLLSDTVEPGDILQLALFWRAEKPITERYKVFVHLYDEEGSVVAQTDSEPGADLRPTNTWLPGETVIDRYGVSIPQETPSGRYRLVVGLYSLTDPDQRLDVLEDGRPVGDHIQLTTIRVSGDVAE